MKIGQQLAYVNMRFITHIDHKPRKLKQLLLAAAPATLRVAC
jgi:hypothetical protein